MADKLGKELDGYARSLGDTFRLDCSLDEMNRIQSVKRCAHCKYFTMHFHTLEPESQRCKKYNKPTKMATDANDCKGYKERQ